MCMHKTTIWEMDSAAHLLHVHACVVRRIQHFIAVVLLQHSHVTADRLDEEVVHLAMKDSSLHTRDSKNIILTMHESAKVMNAVARSKNALVLAHPPGADASRG